MISYKSEQLVGRCAHCCAEVIRTLNTSTSRTYYFCLDMQHTLEPESFLALREQDADPCLLDSLEIKCPCTEGLDFWHTGLEVGDSWTMQ